MGNKPTRNNIQQPYQQIVEDAVAALKERPGSTQNDVFNYLETKYEGKISPKVKRNLQTVLRSVIKTKEGLKRRRGRLAKGIGRGARFKLKNGPRRKAGRLPPRRLNRLGKGSKKKRVKHLKSGKKLALPGSKAVSHRLFKSSRGETSSKFLLRPAGRRNTTGPKKSSRLLNERCKRS